MANEVSQWVCIGVVGVLAGSLLLVRMRDGLARILQGG